MRIDILQQLSASLEAADIDLLELRGPGVWLRLGRDAAQPMNVAVQGASTPAPALPSPASLASRASRDITVKAPSAGVFLHAHPMQSAPLASTGARVPAGAAIGLLQIGALLLPVRAPCAAVVGALRVAHGAMVGYGTPLVELDPD